MDVILLQSVDKLGDQGTVVNVKDGFARNYLFPRGMAAIATSEHISAVKEIAKQRSQQSERVLQQSQSIKNKLESRSLTLKLSLGQDDKPFGSITVHDVVEALRKDGYDIEKHSVGLKEPIKALGIYEVPVSLPAQVSANLKLWVVKE